MGKLAPLGLVHPIPRGVLTMSQHISELIHQEEPGVRAGNQVQAFELTVYGTPAPQGSKTAGRAKSGASFVRDANKRTKPWRGQVAQAAGARAQELNWKPGKGPVEVEMRFYMARPRGHLSKKADTHLVPSAPLAHTKKPDLLKLGRAVEDSLTGIVYYDDSQVVRQVLSKLYGSPERVEIRVRTLELEKT